LETGRAHADSHSAGTQSTLLRAGFWSEIMLFVASERMISEKKERKRNRVWFISEESMENKSIGNKVKFIILHITSY